MADHISLRIRVATDELPDRLAALFAADEYSPVAIGGLAPGASGARWFLAGLALEDFVGRFLERRTDVSVDVRLTQDVDRDEAAYLESLRARIRDHDSPIAELSPYERRDERLGATSIDGPPLDASVLDELEAWRDGADGAVAYVYGSVALAARGLSEPRPLFRDLFPTETGQRSIGAPYVLLRTERDASRSTVDLYTAAAVWLRDGGGLNGHVGPENADANLDTLVALARALAPGGESSTLLRLEGGTFARERQRLEERFRDVAESIEVEG